MTVDNRTSNLSLLLPDVSNSLKVDVQRLVESFTILDTEMEKKAKDSELATVAKTGNYNDLKNKPILATVASTGIYSDLKDKPALSTVALTGSYLDLVDAGVIDCGSITGKIEE